MTCHSEPRKEITRVVDLFCGGGGMSMGFENAGFSVAASIDNWKVALDHCRANFNHDVRECDLGDVNHAVEMVSAYQPDLIIGGPPCQDFSSAGKRDESGGRADLTVSFAEIITTARPAFFVMENVERALRSKAYRAAMKIFRDAGYGTTSMILDASLCGVPQIRKRLIVVGGIGQPDGFLHEHLLEHQAHRPLTVKEYFGKKLDIKHYYRHPRSYHRRAIFSVDEPSPTVRGVNRPVPAGYPGHPGDPVPISDEIRPLTTRERAMIQTFPACYRLAGNKSDVEQLIGNAVPVKLAEHVAMALKSYLERSVALEEDAFVLYEQPSRYIARRAGQPALQSA